MSRGRRHHTPPKPRPTYRATQSDSAEAERKRRSLVPTVLWEAGALVGLALLVGFLVVTLPHGFPPRSARTFFAVVILTTVITLALALKGLEAFLNWKEARSVSAAPMPPRG